MIEFKADGRIGRVTINRSEAHNAFTAAMMVDLAGALTQAASACDIMVISAEGQDFTLGRDRAEPKSGAPFDAFSKVSAVNEALGAFGGITIAAVQGRAFGFGVGLAMRCDLAVAASDARFCLDEVKLGFPPMFIMEEILQGIGPKRAADWILLSEEFGAADALAGGLVSRVVPPESLGSTVQGMADTLAARDAHVLRASKQYLRDVRALPAEARPAYALLKQTRFALDNH